MNRSFLCATLLLLATAAGAQQSSIDPDDFVDPRQHERPVFISRLVLGAGRGLIDHYRALGQDVGFVQITNTLYREHWEFGYNHTEVRGNDGPPKVFRCDCKPPIYFPTPPAPDAAPNPPPPGSKNTVLIGFYRETKAGPAAPPIMLRTRLFFSRQHIDTELRSASTEQVIDHRSGHEQSFGVDADTHFQFRGHALWGSVAYARTSSSGTIDDRTQQELTYTWRPPGWAAGLVLMRTTLTVGGVSNRGGTALNVVNPAFEAFWHSDATKANVHLVWSPQTTRDGENGWKTTSQIALYVDRALWVYFFR
jgi:hypothetical protein